MVLLVPSLGSLCLDYCANNPEIYSIQDEKTDLYKIKGNVHVPVQICDSLLRIRRRNGQLTRGFLHIFSDQSRTALESVDLSYCHGLDDECIEWVMQHNLSELNLLGLSCSFKLNQILKEHSENLRSLHIDGSLLQCWCVINAATHNFGSPKDPHRDKLAECKYRSASVMCCPRLTSLSIHKLADLGFHMESTYPMLYKTLKNSPKLVYLDLSNACLSKNVEFPSESLQNLRTLILFGAYIYDAKEDIGFLFPNIAKLKNLRVLDIGGRRLQDTSQHSGECLGELVKALPQLKWLDIAGTGYIKPLLDDNTKISVEKQHMAWLGGRQFEFLGLLYCSPLQLQPRITPCNLHNIPARLVTGEANEKQLCFALKTYINRRSEFLVLNPLKDLLKIIENDTYRKIKVYPEITETVLSVMEKWPEWKRVQIIGCASLFHMARDIMKHGDPNFIRRTLLAVFSAVERQNSSQMLRKAGMTLLKFKLPEDVMFALDKFLLAIIKMVKKHDGITRVTETIGMYILHRIASPLSTEHKEKVGHLGGIKAICEFLSRDFGEDIFMDDTVVNAWSILYSITDEAPANSRYFIEESGVNLFIKYYRCYPSHEHMLTEMMGVLSNVAEVTDCHPKMIHADLIRIICDFATKGDLEKKNSACSALSHLLSDRTEAWDKEQHSGRKNMVMQIIHNQVDSWNVKSYRSIEYRSLEPLARLLSADHAPAAQHFASWEINNLLNYKVQKYLPMMVRDGVLDAIQRLSRFEGLHAGTYRLVQASLHVCEANKEYRNVHQGEDYDSDTELERAIDRIMDDGDHDDSDHEDDEDDDEDDLSGDDSGDDLGGLYFDVLDFAMDASSDDSLSDSEDSDDGDIQVLPIGLPMLDDHFGIIEEDPQEEVEQEVDMWQSDTEEEEDEEEEEEEDMVHHGDNEEYIADYTEPDPGVEEM